MISVALIGPDGSGKTTIARRLEATLPVPTKYLYMGVSLDSSSSMLLTSRLLRRVKSALGARRDTTGPRDSRVRDARPRGPLRRFGKELRSLASLGNRMAGDGSPGAVLIDSVDVWVANLLLEHEGDSKGEVEALALAASRKLLRTMEAAEASYFLVSGEVGHSRDRFSEPRSSCSRTSWATW